MTLSAYAAGIFTNNSISTHDMLKLQTEVDLTERTIRNAATLQRRAVQYNATTVGNPYSDPLIDSNLTSLQMAYRDAFVTAGYLVSLDARTGYWDFSWASRGTEGLVSVYSIRTTVTPGAISANTIKDIDTFFALQTTAAYSSTTVLSVNGGDILESGFGSTNSVFYEYTSVVQQQTNITDLSPALKLHLSTGGVGISLGYNSTNINAYKLV